LALNGTSGVVSGTPGAGGTFAGTLTASNGVAPAATQSFSIVIARMGQTITFGTLSNQVFGAAPINISATASSGLPVSFVSLTAPVCAVSGNSVTLVAVGMCTIQASQAGNANYDAATSVERSFTVTAGAANDTVWVEDALPAGATPAGDGGDSWNWISSNPTPYSGVLAHRAVVASAEHQHYFYNATATLSVAVSDSLFAYVYLDAVNPPSEEMLQWNDGSWEHRA